MTEKTIKVPDIGEGITESEISEWLVAPGDQVMEDDALVVMMTDKAAVEIPSGVSGKVTWLAADAGDVLPVGAPLLKIEVPEDGDPDTGAAPSTDAGDDTDAATEPEPVKASEPETVEAPVSPDPDTTQPAKAPSPKARKALASPAVRKRAADLGVDLGALQGSGPEGRVTHADLDRHLVKGTATLPRGATDAVTEQKLIGLRRKIAEQMTRAHASIAAMTIVEDVDVTELERLRARMNDTRREDQPKLTLLPFLIRAMDVARSVAPQVNARFDDAEGLLRQFEALHIGIATQTDNGLVVPVIAHAESCSMWTLASEIARLAKGAREGKLSREELGGSTMTITSLGALGAFASTPIINHPEVGIVGVNRKAIRPVWDGTRFAPREVMNLSASFDHRIVDGWDAALFVARMKELLETPALLFVAEDPHDGKADEDLTDPRANP